MTSERSLVAVSLFVAVLLLSPAFAPDAHATGFVVCGCQKIGERTLQPGVVETTYRAKLINFGAAIPGATATIGRHPKNVQVVDGTVTFGPVGRWRAAWSDDTFTIVRNRPTIFDCLKLEWTVVITTGNRPPVANAGPDQTAPLAQTVTLDGSGSTDVDGDPLTFAWQFDSIPQGSQAVLSDPAAVNPHFEIDLPGSYVVRLIVNDGVADSPPDTVTISTENSPPVANAGPDETAPVGSTIALDGSGSTDADNDPLTFAWSFVTVPAGSAATLSDPTAVAPSFVMDRPGTYELQLIVHDGIVESAPDTVAVTTENSSPVADAGPDQTLQAGETAFLDGAASSDADGDPLSFAWSLTTRPAGSSAAILDAATATPSFVADVAGTYVAQLIVNDGAADSVPDTVVLTAEAETTVTVSTTDDRAAENGPDPGVFTITRTGQTSDPLTVTFQLLGSATNGTDYETLATSATIPAGAATTTVTVTPRADLDVEGNESVILSLSPGADYTIGSQGLAGLTITDSVVVTVAAIDPDASELGLDPGVFTFTRSGGDQSAPLVLTFARDGTASNAADFENIGFTVTIPANQSSVAVTIAPLADNALEGPETVLLTINPSNAYTVGPPSGPVTIADDPVIVTLSAADAAASEAGPDPGVFAFTRTGGNPAAQLNVFFALGGTAANNGDFLLIGGNIIIPAGQLSATLTITPRQDNNVEAAETVVVTLEPRPTYAIGSPSTATITIADDPAVVTVVATDPDASESGANPAVFTVTRTGGNPAAALTVIVSRGGTASNGSDYGSLGGANFAVTIPANQASATVTVTPIQDGVAEGPETVILTINPSPAFIVAAPASATVTIVD